MTHSQIRGHAMICRAGRWFYKDGGRVSDDPQRDCGRCGRPATPEGHDGCLGTLPGVANACCGHGQDADAYIQFDDGRTIRGIAARRLAQETLGI